MLLLRRMVVLDPVLQLVLLLSVLLLLLHALRLLLLVLVSHARHRKRQ